MNIEQKYSLALQKFLGYNIYTANGIAREWANADKVGNVIPLECYPDPDAYYDDNGTLHMPNNKVFTSIEFKNTSQNA